MAQRIVPSLTTFQQTVRSAIARYPEQAERIKRAALLVAMDHVGRVTDEAYVVISQSRPDIVYSIAAGTYRDHASGCTCEDKISRKPVSCVHEWSVDLVQVAQERQRRLDQRERFAVLSTEERQRLTAWKRRYMEQPA